MTCLHACLGIACAGYWHPVVIRASALLQLWAVAQTVLIQGRVGYARVCLWRGAGEDARVSM